jgi:excisionase family DNA binding protein
MQQTVKVTRTRKPGARDTNAALLTVHEVARTLRVDDTTVRRWIKKGILDAVILPHVNAREAYRIKRETLENLLGETNNGQN